jgi:hypothetical protein
MSAIDDFAQGSCSLSVYLSVFEVLNVAPLPWQLLFAFARGEGKEKERGEGCSLDTCEMQNLSFVHQVLLQGIATLCLCCCSCQQKTRCARSCKRKSLNSTTITK